MVSPAPFLDVIGFPDEGGPVDPTPRAAQHLVAAGGTSPDEERPAAHNQAIS
ncbi:hypothetical protein [Arthrobacter agilis]|uniref:hypothetical protein n=1 Tax=Arthrobacter agilis TaxID=37921 RepID=UPI002780934B|nr:hypothetical protein [Arthrobacter agilis]MDQ0735159.1 hypothetical protein [Arthrobacter agilis]